MKILILIIFFSHFTNVFGRAQLLDKVVGVINQKSFSLSEVRRIKDTFEGRKMIAPMIYEVVDKSSRGIIKHLFHIYIIRNELEKIGYKVTDERVENQIKNTLARLKMTKQQLMTQLSQNGLNYQEYEEIIRESMEFSLFNQKIISPLVIVSEQEVKSFHWKNIGKRKSTASVEYKLKDYMVEKEVSFSEAMRIKKEIQKYIKKNKEYKKEGVDPIDFGSVKSENLDKKISAALIKLKKGELSKPILIQGYYHIFHIINRKESESDQYQDSKVRIANYLYQEKSRNVMDSYFEQKTEDDYYTKYL